MRSDGRAAVAVVGPAVVAAVFAGAAWAYRPYDWTVLHTAGKSLLGGDLAVYGQHPEAQSGPLALVAAGLPRPIFVAFTCALLVAVTEAARRLGVPDRTVLLGGLVGAIPWGLFALEGHVDDALVVVGAATMLVGAHQHRRSLLGLGFVLAVAAKPTGVVLAPLLLVAGWHAAALAMVGVAALWLPMVLPDVQGFLEAGGGIAGVMPWSGPFMLGEPFGAEFPWWVRPVQLAGALVICFLLVKRGGAAAGVLAAVAFRVLLEPGAWPSYSSSLVVLALLLPVRRGVAISLAASSWAFAYLYPLSALEGTLRAASLGALILLTVSVASRPVYRSGILDPAPRTTGSRGPAADAPTGALYVEPQPLDR